MENRSSSGTDVFLGRAELPFGEQRHVSVDDEVFHNCRSSLCERCKCDHERSPHLIGDVDEYDGGGSPINRKENGMFVMRLK